MKILKQALVTGGAKGIGLAISEKLAQQKWDLFLCGRQREALEIAKTKIESLHLVKVQIKTANLSYSGDVEDLAAHWKKDNALPQALICNAGDYGVLGNLQEVDFQEWKKSFDLNFFSIVHLIQNYVQLAVKCDPEPRKKIIVMSGSGLGGSQVHPGISAYACAKAALYRLVEVLHEEVHPKGIDINCIAPGFVKTGITEQAARAGSQTLGELANLSQKILNEGGGTSPNIAADMISDLLESTRDGLSGRLISAKWDKKLLASREDVAKIEKDTDLFRLRRIDNDLFCKKTNS